MFKCQKCEVLQQALEYERERNKDLSNRLIALADAKAFQAVSIQRVDDGSYYGNGDNDFIEQRNEFGERILVKQKNERAI